MNLTNSSTESTMNITMITSEICDLLGVNKNTLKSIIKRGKLEDRLNVKGYTLVNKYKSGRDNIYELSFIKETSWSVIQLKNNIYKNKEYDNDKFSETRINNLKESRSKVIQLSKTGIADETAKRYDDILVKEGVIKKGEEVYYLYNFKTKEYEEKITKEEYKAFWVYNAELKRQIRSLRARRDKYEISNSQYDILIYSTYEQYGNVEKKIAVKFNTYEEMELTQSILKEIKEKLAKRKSVV